jgi:hypothetical protein
MIGGLGAIALAATPARSADLQPMIVTPLTGNVHFFQSIPICSDLNFDRAITGGRIEIAPAEGIDVVGGKAFMFTRISVFVSGFHIHDSCLGSSDDETYFEIGASLGQAVVFIATPGGAGVYNFTIPKEAFLVNEAAKHQHNSDPVGADDSLKHPAEDVTGFIDFNLAKVHLHLKIVTSLHFSFGPIDEDRAGSQTADIDGTIVFPDSDGDGIPDRIDNCPLTPNPSQNTITTPVITPPPGVVLNSCLDHHFGLASATDICNARPVVVTNDAPLQFVVGPNTVTWSANDGFDPTQTAQQTVTIVDTTPPVFTFVPPDVHLNDCKGTPLGTPTATDDCAGTVTFTNNALPKYFVGDTPVTWTAHDANGNTSTAVQHVIVVDTVPPTVSCVATLPTGGAFVVSADDACGPPTIRLGSFVLANNETIKINEAGTPGVRLVSDVSNDGFRHFLVGKGEAVITATDGSGNVTSAVCK